MLSDIKAKIIFGDSSDPWRNLAVEEALFERASDMVALFLWQNASTVVIGRNQNAWSECKAELLRSEGGKLARRTSGGGAVYHDLGNLNFSLVCPRKLSDTVRQTGVILNAVNSLGVDARFTGRNDLVTDEGAKFSGNAYRNSRSASLQHGTLLISADMEKLSRYLVPSAEKLRSKGVESVRSRVCNLSEFGSHITVASVSEAVRAAFEEEYGAAETLPIDSLDSLRIETLTRRNSTWEWLMGASPEFDARLTHRFPWGGVELMLTLKAGHIASARLYSDAMDEEAISIIAPALDSVRYAPRDMAEAVAALGSPYAKDIAAWLALEAI